MLSWMATCNKNPDSKAEVIAVMDQEFYGNAGFLSSALPEELEPAKESFLPQKS